MPYTLALTKIREKLWMQKAFLSGKQLAQLEPHLPQNAQPLSRLFAGSIRARSSR
jgi:hypothetical protein